MVAGLIDLDVRYRDVNTLGGVALERIVGIVRNAIGTIIEEIIPEPRSDADGVYYVKEDYDVRDAAKFFGLSLTVEWQAQRFNTILPIFEKRYFFDPVASGPADRTVLYWSPHTDNNLFFYNVYRRRTDANGDTETVFSGKSFGSSFVDEYPFENEFEARSWEYIAKPVLRKPGEIQADGSDYEELDSGINPDVVFRSNDGICTVDGFTMDITGRPMTFTDETVARSSIVFRINWRDRHQVVGNAILSPEDVYVLPTVDGRFSINLVWDTVVEMWIPAYNFKARFLVPRSGRVDFASLSVEILTEK